LTSQRGDKPNNALIRTASQVEAAKVACLLLAGAGRLVSARHGVQNQKIRIESVKSADG
jgi:hypothetical protein